VSESQLSRTAKITVPVFQAPAEQQVAVNVVLARNPQKIVFKPDWAKHANAAPFKRNDQMLEALPAGLVAFPGYGISANLADKARKLGIPVWSHSAEGAA
jgi:hypothetical protein